VPNRGDVIWIDFQPQAGHEIMKRRPALVLSPRSYNAKAGLAVLCPVTSTVRGYPFEVGLPAGHPTSGVVLADQVRSLDWRARNAERVAKVPVEVIDEVVAKIAALIGCI